jgi:two-component system response regulator HydG
MVSNARILIVDDDEVVRLSYLRSLANTHWNVQSSRDGKDALRAMEEKGFDVVLLDLRMPDKSGLDVLREIKDKWPQTEVVIITGYPSIETVKEALRLGACHYLAKPVGPDDVFKAANDAIIQKEWTLHRKLLNQNDRRI